MHTEEGKFFRTLKFACGHGDAQEEYATRKEVAHN